MKIYAINSEATDCLLRTIFLPSISNCEPDAKLIVENVQIGGNGDFLSQEYNSALLYRLERIPEWIRSNFQSVILISDVDIRYLRPFISVMEQSIADHDVAFSQEHKNSAWGINCGQMLIRCSDKTFSFFTAVLYESRKTRESEQTIINKWLNKSDLHYKVLSPLFANTNIGFHEDMYSYHAVCTLPTQQKSSVQLKQEQFVSLAAYLSTSRSNAA